MVGPRGHVPLSVATNVDGVEVELLPCLQRRPQRQEIVDSDVSFGHLRDKHSHTHTHTHTP